MIFVLIAVMSLIQENGYKNTYVWTTPRFTSIEQCQAYAHEYTDNLLAHMQDVFPGDIVNSLYCLPADKLEEFYSSSYEKTEEAT
ncbi:MAG: hypothetical protein CMF52_08745 [Legionellales bacterium]|nr:hypothetical protein [Legionellales bacterium]|tara:strand:+ start:2283 stop:2537 length:255 start_codon:yes stop_codon:yes gene_type:complete